MHSNLETVF